MTFVPHKFTVAAMLALVTSLTMAQSSSAQQGADAVSYSVGLRIWNNQWSANALPTIGGRTLVLRAESNGQKAVPILAGSLRYGDFGVSGSHFFKTSYGFTDSYLPPGSVSNTRRETDVNLLYFPLPGFSASVGYKTIGLDGISFKGPILGASGSAPIGGNIGMYGTIALGALKNNLQNRTGYELTEVGFSYLMSSAFPRMTATLGYRAQRLSIKNVALVGGNQNLRDSIAGLTLGVVASF